MSGIERVTYRPAGGRARSVLLDDVALAGAMLTGRQVDADGSPVEPAPEYRAAHGCAHGTVRHIIELALVVRREQLRIDPIYGTLEPA